MFLGCLEYIFNPYNTKICHNHEYNLIFEAIPLAPIDYTNIPQPEIATSIIWLSLEEIDCVDLRPNKLKEIINHWLNSNASTAFQTQNKL